jgi:Spy/CpxP family protein refolding chaperone
MGHSLGQLDLSDTQRQQIRSIVQSHREEFRALGERTRAARQKLHELVTAEAVDETAIRAASSELAGVQADGAILRARVHQEVFATLTPEQQAKAKQLRSEADQRRQERREQRRQRIEERLKRQGPGQAL